MSEKSVRTIQTPLATVAAFSDGHIEIRFIEEYEVQPENMVEIQNALVNLEIPPSRVLVVPGRYGGISKDARKVDFFDRIKSLERMNVAIVTTLLHHRILGAMYFKYVNKKAYHHKFCKSEAEALQWLNSQ